MLYLFWFLMVLMLLIAIAFILYPLKNKPLRRFDTLIFTFVASAISIASISLYFMWGDSQQLEKYYIAKQNAKIIAAEVKLFKTPQQLIRKLKEVLEQHPNSAQGWFLLGKIYFSINNFVEAEKNYAKANELKPNQPEYRLAYAEVNFALNHFLSESAKSYLIEILKLQPHNVEAINLLALNAYAGKQYQQAIDYWEQLLPLFLPNSTDAKSIMKAIELARGHILHI